MSWPPLGPLFLDVNLTFSLVHVLKLRFQTSCGLQPTSLCRWTLGICDENGQRSVPVSDDGLLCFGPVLLPWVPRPFSSQDDLVQGQIRAKWGDSQKQLWFLVYSLPQFSVTPPAAPGCGISCLLSCLLPASGE